MGHSQHVSASSITLLLTKEVEEILYGNEEKYKGREIASKGKLFSQSVEISGFFYH